jgi:hypothetical protein
LNYLSFLVDKTPLSYYQSELLLFSLEQFTSFNKDNILIHCTTRVDDEFLFFLNEQRYKYKIVEPYLDGKYCNKLQQLASFKNLKSEDGVFLIDSDTFFLNDPSLLFSQKIGGKVVDAPNPPLRVLTKIFNEAKLNYPKIVRTDWIMEDAFTFESNFNGGFYYIPAKKVEMVDSLWKKWATWLYSHLELFETDVQRIHVDQVSFSMMIQDANQDYQVLSSNNNCPIHRATKQRLFDISSEISMIHYHRSLNSFGFLETNLSINPIVDKAILKINRSIEEKNDFIFYKYFNKSFIQPLNSTEKTKKFEKNITNLISNQKNIKIILHAGTPKTATTSLQFFLDKNYDKLIEQDILYPKYYLDTNPPKHQWLVSLLRQNDFDKLFEYLEKIIVEASLKNIKTIFLSTEGIYNHWWDFSSEAKEVLKIIAKEFKFELYIVFRESSSFLESFYKQNLKNPQMSSVSCYGKDLSFSEMLKDKWFIKHLDYLGFIQESESLFGKNNVKVFTYSQKIIEKILESINFIYFSALKDKQENVGQSSIGVDLLRVLNRYNLNSKDKKESITILKKMDKVLENYQNSSSLKDEKESIERLFSIQSKVLTLEYKVDFSKLDSSE